MRPLVEFAVARRVTILMTALAVLAFGVVGYKRLAIELLPDVSYPSLTVRTEFPDTAPAEVENLVTRPVEEAVGVLQGLERIHSISKNGVSEVTLAFAWGTDMGERAMDVREKIDRLTLPEETDAPVVLRYDPSLDPVLRLALTGPDDLGTLRRFADRKLKPELETVTGVAAAQLKGGVEEEIHVDLDQGRLAALGISLAEVAGVVRASNLNLPGGTLEDSRNRFLIRTVGEFKSVEEIGGLAIRSGPDGVVRVRDIADVARGQKDREEITRVDGEECVEIAVFKEGDGNVVSVADALTTRLADLDATLPQGYELRVLFDQARFIRQAIQEVRNTAFIGGLLAVGVLFAFLRDFRSTAIVATAIPLSLIATFVVMYRMGISLNIMSLGGLTLGVGMLVDNAIVVLESIHRHRMRGSTSAAVDGTLEVGGAVLASTLTTVAVFLPIVFVEGIAGQLFRDLAITVTVSLIASLVVAITVIPSLSARRGAKPATAAPAVASPAPAAGLGPLSRGYDRLLRGALAKPVLTVSVAAILFAASIAALPSLGRELIPSIREGQFYFDLVLPEGSSLARTDRNLTAMEMQAAGVDGIHLVYTTVGSRIVAGGMSLNTQAENVGQLNVVLTERGDEAIEDAIAENLRGRFVVDEAAEVRLGRPTYFSLQTPVEVVVFGDNLDELAAICARLERKLSSIDGLIDVRSSLDAGNPELQIHFDRAKVAALGLDLRTLSDALNDRVQGEVATRYKEGDQQFDVLIRNRERDRRDLDDIRNLVVPGPDNTPIRLLTVADVEPARGPAEIHRLQQQRAAMLTANVAGRTLGDVVDDIDAVINDDPAFAGQSIEIGGQNREMNVSFNSLRFAIGLAIFLVYLVMAGTFESLVHPFVVLFTIPLALVGVVAGLFFTATPVSVIVLIGAIMLVGIVVNNAIVLIDNINRQRSRGFDVREAVIAAGNVRVRPILMTTLTTVLGLLPMALGFGEGAELRTPLAITVSAGLAFSTLLTLVVVPVVYRAMTRTRAT
jgi:HAE1 family hydrophobic/amphiphilic exporter-1